MEVNGEPAQSDIRYTDLLLEDWANGLIRSWSLGPLVIDSRAEDDPVRITIGGTEARRINIATIAHVFDPERYRDGRGDHVWRSAVDSARYSGIEIAGPDGGSFAIAEIGFTNVDLRQADRPFVTAAERLMADPDMDEEEGLAFAREFLPAIPIPSGSERSGWMD